VWLHHTVTGAVNGTAIIREVEAIGEARFGTGISYTWLVTPDGSVYEGHSPGRMGTHTGGRNSIARAICWVGNYDIVQPTTAQVEATAWLLQEAHRRGWIRVPRLNGGHRDLKATACPGKNAYALIGRINSLAAGQPVAKETDVNLDDVMVRDWDGKRLTIEAALFETHQNAEDALKTVRQVAAMVTGLTDDETKILAAIRAGGVDPVAFAALVGPLIQPGMTREQVTEAATEGVRLAFERAGAQEGGE
jgi:hypothetical protein